jgi:aerobic carbon-monoxide dehydrogenase small subunit
MNKVHVTTAVNGEPIEFLCEPHQSMLEALRDELRLTGTKEGCGTGDCGACSILLNERLVCSCLMLAVESEGQQITTVEGISAGERLHPIQRVFLEEAALQCGVCTPGLMVATKALLAHNADPSEEQIRYWLAGNLCRCTGYDKIIRAVQVAAGELRETST